MHREHVELKKFKKVMLVFNPNSGRRLFVDTASRVNDIRNQLRELLGVQVLTEVSIYSFEEVRTIAQRICNEHYEWVIVAGGDGTLRAITEVFVENGKLPYMSVYPVGTVNLVAKELMLPADPDEWMKKVKRGMLTPVWLGQANNRVFLTVAGIGIDSLVIDKVTETEKKYLSKFAYVIEGTELVKRELLWQDWQYKFQVMINNDGIWRDAASVIVAKSRYYAGWFSLVDGASLSSAKLHVCLFHGVNKLDLLRYLGLLLTDSLATDKSVEILEAQSVEIRCNEENFAAELDGDSLVTSPLSISLLPEPVQFIA
ncbi:MAG TPA: diacylglycerol kinase [Candidatus Avacidaminococcus intestinavium]|uniref:Diacylglycerol kinase n=1 Tax=Candidatus Avacidaminococcus intestinavium TaxID=2840684 RepID=A0A9D1MQ07_9FIRM|nr:diacylglycerol kinase [Candidatus Avacidaminococcus intestinavium]